MKPVTLNLATRPFRNNVVVGTLLTVIGAGLLSATGYNLYVYLGYGSAYASLQQEQTDDRGRIVKLQEEERRLAEEIRKRNFRHAFERGKLASELVRKSAFSWTQLFNTLETVVPPDVVMTAIRPNISADAIVLRIEGVAKNPIAFLTLQERLLKNPLFTRVFPASERKLNPSLQDVTFLLTCDYLPRAPQSADRVAQKPGAETAGAPAAGTTDGGVPGEGAPATTPVETAAAAPATGGVRAPTGGGTAAAAPGTRVAQGSRPVGRDGLPIDALAMTVLAPGALHTPPAAAPAPESMKGGGRRRQGSADSRTKPADSAVKPHAAPPSRQPAAGAVSGDDAIGGGVSGGGHAAPDGAASGGGAAGGKPLSAIEARTSPAGRVWDPNVTRTMPAEVKARRAAEPKPPEKPVPAARLDMPLSFTRAPAGDVYDRLAKAHGVRFEFGPGVDRAVPVTLNLQGRPLGIALEMMMLQTRHRVVRKADGVYMIEGPEAGRAIGVAPVTEETIQGEAP